MPVRRVPRAKCRAEFWADQIAGAADGEQALTAAVRWLRKEITTVAEQRPEIAEAARWDMARQIAAYAARLPRARMTLRAGLTADERWHLLNPWTRGEGSR